MPGLRGQHLYELSELAGPGSSGSPIVLKPLVRLMGAPSWRVIGSISASTSCTPKVGLHSQDMPRALMP